MPVVTVRAHDLRIQLAETREHQQTRTCVEAVEPFLAEPCGSGGVSEKPGSAIIQGQVPVDLPGVLTKGMNCVLRYSTAGSPTNVPVTGRPRRKSAKRVARSRYRRQLPLCIGRICAVKTGWNERTPRAERFEFCCHERHGEYLLQVRIGEFHACNSARQRFAMCCPSFQRFQWNSQRRITLEIDKADAPIAEGVRNADGRKQ